MSKEITTKQEFMNMQDIANLVDCSVSTVRRKVLEKMPEKLQNGIETIFNQEEAFLLVGEMRAEIKKQIAPIQSEEVLSPAELLLKQAKMMVAQERQIKENVNRIEKLEQITEKQKVITEILPEVKPTTMRKNLNRIVRSMGEVIGFQAAWKNLYTEYYYRYEINITTRCKNYNQKNGAKLNVLDYAEQFEHLEHLLSLAIELFTYSTIGGIK